MTDAVTSWKAYVSATAAGRGVYGEECGRLSAYGMADVVETHFVEATEVRAAKSRTASRQKKNNCEIPKHLFLNNDDALQKQPTIPPSQPPPLPPLPFLRRLAGSLRVGLSSQAVRRVRTPGRPRGGSPGRLVEVGRHRRPVSHRGESGHLSEGLSSVLVSCPPPPSTTARKKN